MPTLNAKQLKAGPARTPVRIALPPSPIGISRETSLAELQSIKSAWVQAAQEAGFPEMLWEVVNCLGKPVSI